MSNIRRIVLTGSAVVLVLVLAGLISSGNAQVRKVKAAFTSDSEVQQPLYTEYKGIRLGMTVEQVRGKLGQPLLKGDDGDLYSFTDQETAQIVYDANQKVRTISVDYLGGVGAPDPKTVVGGELETRNGADYKLVRYESLGFWVSYNRTPGTVTMITITIQKI